jgi:hypothetical protein
MIEDIKYLRWLLIKGGYDTEFIDSMIEQGENVNSLLSANELFYALEQINTSSENCSIIIYQTYIEVSYHQECESFEYKRGEIKSALINAFEFIYKQEI